MYRSEPSQFHLGLGLSLVGGIFSLTTVFTQTAAISGCTSTVWGCVPSCPLCVSWAFDGQEGQLLTRFRAL